MTEFKLRQIEAFDWLKAVSAANYLAAESALQTIR